MAELALIFNPVTGGFLGKRLRTEHIADASITSSKIAANAIGAGHVADGAIGTAELANSAVTSAKIAAGTVGGALLQDPLLPASDGANDLGSPATRWRDAHFSRDVRILRNVGQHASFTVGGTSDTFYPVQFGNYAWPDISVSNDLMIYRHNVHVNGTWFGTFYFKISFHPTRWGHFDKQIEKIEYCTGRGSPYNDPVGDVVDGSTTGHGRDLIVWLRGGATYEWRTLNMGGWTLLNGNPGGTSITDSSGIVRDPITSQSALILNAKNRFYANSVSLGTAGSLLVASFGDLGALRIGGTEVITAGRAIQNATLDASLVTTGAFPDARIASGLTADKLIGTVPALPLSGRSLADLGTRGHGLLTGITPDQHHIQFTSGMHNFPHPTGLIADGAVTAAKIAANAVGASELANNSVDTAAILSGAVTGDKIAANAIGAGHIIDGAVGTAELATDAVTAAKIAANAVGASELANNAVDTAAILSGAVTGAKIAANAIGAGHIINGAVGTAELATNAVTAAKIAANAVGASELANNAVDTAAILSGAVTGAKIAANAIGAGHIINGAVGTAELATNAVTSGKIVQSDLRLGWLGERAHGSLTGIGANDHHIQFTSGMHNFVHPVALIPDLDTSKITTGRFPADRLPIGIIALIYTGL